MTDQVWGYKDGVNKFLEESSGGSMPALQTATRHVTSAEILDLGTSQLSDPIVIVPAPGAGKVILPQQALIRLNFVTTPYDTTTRVVFDLGVDSDATFGAAALNLLGQTGTRYIFVDAAASYDNQQDVTAKVEDVPVILTVGGSGSPTDGDGTLDIWFMYRVLDVT